MSPKIPLDHAAKHLREFDGVRWRLSLLAQLLAAAPYCGSELALRPKADLRDRQQWLAYRGKFGAAVPTQLGESRFSENSTIIARTHPNG